MRAFPFLFLVFVALSWPQTLEQLSKQGNDLIAAKDLPAAEQFFGAAADKARAASDRRWEAEFERGIGETLSAGSTMFARGLNIRKRSRFGWPSPRSRPPSTMRRRSRGTDEVFVPEPATFGLFAAGLGGLLMRRRKLRVT